MLDRADIERPPLHEPGVPAPARLVRDVVPRAEVAVEEEDGDGADEREQGDGGRDPQRPSVRAEVHGNDVRGRLAGELREVSNRPNEAYRDRMCMLGRLLLWGILRM